MLLYLRDLSPEVFLVYTAASMLAILTGLAFHEFSHAWAANELGDDTAARQGRLTLNPLAHLDPLGTALMFLIGFGWAKPTPVNTYRLRNGPRKGNAIVAFAGPASNFFFAALAGIPLKTGWISTDKSSIEALVRLGTGEDYLALFLFFVVTRNVLLGVFNLIPIPPLDGFSVAQGIVPRAWANEMERLKRWGPGILMGLFVIGIVNPALSPLYWIFDVVDDVVYGVLL